MIGNPILLLLVKLEFTDLVSKVICFTSYIINIIFKMSFVVFFFEGWFSLFV